MKVLDVRQEPVDADGLTDRRVAESEGLTFRVAPLGLVHLDELLADAARGVDQLVEPLELHRVLRLLVVRLLTRLAEREGETRRWRERERQATVTIIA